MTKRDVLKSWANTWRSLAAWGAVLPMKIEIKAPRKNQTRRRGTAWFNECRAIVYDDGDLASNLKTILHELAHLAAPSYTHHEMPWREMFARGAAEALGCDVHSFDLDVELEALNLQVRDAVIAWLDRTGQAIVLKAIGVL